MKVSPDISWVDVDDSDRTVLLFNMKQKWIYVHAMTEIDGWLTCCMKDGTYGRYYLSLDRFEISATGMGSSWRVGWVQDGNHFQFEMSYPIPYLPGVRFCNPLVFFDAFGEYRRPEDLAVEDWWGIIFAARSKSDTPDCQAYCCNSFRWKMCYENESMFNTLWDKSSPRGYRVSNELMEGRRPEWLEQWKAYRAKQERQITEDIFRRRNEAILQRNSSRKLKKLRKRNIKINPLELMAYGCQNTAD